MTEEERNQQIRQEVEETLAPVNAALARSGGDTKLDKAVQKAISERSSGGRDITKKEAEEIYNQARGREIKAERDAKKQAIEAIRQENKFNRAWGNAKAEDLMKSWRSNKKNNYGREVGNISEFDDDGRVLPDSETKNAQYITQSRKMGERDAAEMKALRESQPDFDESSRKDMSAAAAQDVIDARNMRAMLDKNIVDAIFKSNPDFLRKYPKLQKIGGLVSQANKQLTDEELKKLMNSSGVFDSLADSENFTAKADDLPKDYNWVRGGEDGQYLTPNELLNELTGDKSNSGVGVTQLRTLMEQKLGPSVFTDKYPLTAEDVFKVLTALRPSVKAQYAATNIPESQKKLEEAVANKVNAANTMSSPKDAFGSYYGYLKNNKGDVYDMLTKAADLYGRSNNIHDEEGNFSLPKSMDKLYKEIQNAFKAKYNINNPQEHEQWKNALEQLNLHDENNLSTINQIHSGMESGNGEFEGYGPFIKNFLQNYTTDGQPTPLIPKDYAPSEIAQKANDEQTRRLLEQISQRGSTLFDEGKEEDRKREEEIAQKLRQLDPQQQLAFMAYWDELENASGNRDSKSKEIMRDKLATYIDEMFPEMTVTESPTKPKKKVTIRVKKPSGTASDERVKNIIGGISNGIFD